MNVAKQIEQDEAAQYQQQLSSSRIILFAQTISVIASISGLIGVYMAYKLLTSQENGKRRSGVNVPTIE